MDGWVRPGLACRQQQASGGWLAGWRARLKEQLYKLFRNNQPFIAGSREQGSFAPIPLHCALLHCFSSDPPREYLGQRHFSSVLYLNGPDGPSGFTGGDLCFREDAGGDEMGQLPPGEGPVSRVTPRAGRLVAYEADERNVHMVG